MSFIQLERRPYVVGGCCSAEWCSGDLEPGRGGATKPSVVDWSVEGVEGVTIPDARRAR
jgi:hypothetical protein